VLQICPDAESKLAQIPVGVDGDMFHPVPAEHRPATINRLIQQLNAKEKLGKTPQMQQQTWQAIELPDEAKVAAAALNLQSRYNASYPDVDLGLKLAQINWHDENILIYFGKLLFDKGVHCLIMAMPNILAAFPNTKLIIIGSGMDREFLEMGVAALDQGNLDCFQRVMHAGMAGRREGDQFYEYVTRFLESTNQAAYVEHARGRMKPNVIFTGYMTRAHLAMLLPCARIALVPSIIKEAFPLVSIESLACGVVPMASYFSGLAPILDQVAAALGASGDLIKIGHKPKAMIHDLSHNIPALLSVLGSNGNGAGEEISATCRGLVELKYRWKTIVSEMGNLYKTME
jgi:glycosyltransferase involved in cell wall biosynthesis